MAAEVKLISSMATRTLLEQLLAQYREATGVAAACESVGGVDAARRVADGEVLDLVVLADTAIDKLIAAGRVVPGSRVDLVRSGVAVAVREGAPLPDIHDEAALRAAVMAAPTIGYSTGPSGVHLENLFARWGVLEALKPRIVQARPGLPVGTLVARGEVALGFQQLSELMHLPGITVVGPLPPGAQTITTFSAGLASAATQPEAARALATWLASPAAEAAKRAHGMSPA